MYHVTTELAAALASQQLHIRVTCGNMVLDADRITNLSYSASCGGGEVLIIGGVTAASVTMTITGRVDLLNQIITVEVGALLEGIVTYIPLGTFAVAENQQTEDSTVLTAYDAAYWALGGAYVPQGDPLTALEVLRDIAAQCDLTMVMPWDVAQVGTAAVGQAVIGWDASAEGDLTGHTCREMVGYMAAMLGRNALIDREGRLVVRWFADNGCSVTPEDYYADGLTLGGSHTLTGIVCTVPLGEDDGTLYVGDASGDRLILESPYMTQGHLDAVWEAIGGLAYMEGTCNMVNGLLLEPGDLITVTDSAGNDSVIPVMELTLTLDGGCQATVTAAGESSTASDANVTGPLNAAVSDAAERAEAAAKTATNYLSFDANTGLDVSYAGTSAKTRIQGNGVEVFDGDGNSAAFFGTVDDEPISRIGDENAGHVVIDEDSVDIMRGSDLVARFGNGVSVYNHLGAVVAEISNVLIVGYRSTASGSNSCAVGTQTTASGPASVALGFNTVASGWYSHAQNAETVAASECQTVIGNQNVIDRDNEYLFIIGNGTYEQGNRSNALTVDWFGNLVCAGNVTAKGFRVPEVQSGRLGSASCAANAYTDVSVTFSRRFSGTPVVTVSFESDSTGVSMGSLALSVHTRSATGFKIRVYNNSSTARTPALMWIAVY